jgi:hypothetical protein
VGETSSPFLAAGTWSRPCPTFTQALNAAWGDVRIKVAPGTYVPAGVLVTGPRMLVQGYAGGGAVLGN